MVTAKKLQVIDADAHVVETERTWDYLDPSDQKYRPISVSDGGDPPRHHWLVNGKIRGHTLAVPPQSLLAEISRRSGRNVETPEGAREMDNIELRLQHMDQLGIDVQVLHNSMWIEQVADIPEIDVALCRSWNRWMGEIARKGKGRLRWSCVLPLTSMEDALSEMQIAKDNGSVAVCMRPIEEERFIHDPYFYPIYEEASRLDMAIAVHIANGNRALSKLYMAPYDPFSSFGRFRGPTVVACHQLLMSELPHRFPTLRWGFIEASSQWVPWVIHEAARRYQGAGKKFPENIMREYRIYVTCETDDDLPYILQYTGEYNLVIGTDYGHADPSSELDAIEIFKQKSGISQAAKDKILCDNPKRFYGL